MKPFASMSDAQLSLHAAEARGVLDKLETPALKVEEELYRPGLCIPRHSHSTANFIYIVAGTHWSGHSRGGDVCAPGTVRFIPAGEPHENYFPVGSRSIEIVLRQPILELAAEHGQTSCSSGELAHPSAPALGARLYREFCQKDDVSALEIEAVILQLLLAGGEDSTPRRKPAPPWLLRIREMLREEEHPRLSASGTLPFCWPASGPDLSPVPLPFRLHDQRIYAARPHRQSAITLAHPRTGAGGDCAGLRIFRSKPFHNRFPQAYWNFSPPLPLADFREGRCAGRQASSAERQLKVEFLPLMSTGVHWRRNLSQHMKISVFILGCTLVLALLLLGQHHEESVKSSEFRTVIDLTHALSPQGPNYEVTEKPAFQARTVASIEKDGYFAREISLPEHFGTHLDAPAHFVAGLWTVDQIPVERLLEPLVVIDVRAEVKGNPDYRISVEDIAQWEQAHGQIPMGAVVIAYTGWDSRWNSSKEYRNADGNGVMHFPGYSMDAAKFLVEGRNIVGLGIDTLSIDYGPSKDFPVHHYTLGHSLYHLENVANLDHAPASGAFVVVAPMKLEGGSGGPVRILALLR